MSEAQNMIRLRPYQTEAVERIFSAWRDGMQRPAAVLATGLGKTIIFSGLARHFVEAQTGPLEALRVRPSGASRVVVLVHRDELADQALAKLRMVAPGLNTGKVKAKDNDVTADVMVCSVQTVSRESRARQLLDAQAYAGDIGLVIVDECFPAGTLVGGTPIEKLQPGDRVPTWNEDTGQEEMRSVVRAMKKTPSAMVRVSLEDGSSFACTPNHPILTSRGWCPAGMLTRGALTVSFTHDAKASEHDLHGVRGPGDPGCQRKDRQLQEPGSGVLLGHLPGHLGGPGPLRAYGPDEPDARLGADAPEQPHGPAGEPGEDDRDPAPHWAQAQAAWRERFGSDGTAEAACPVPGLADRGDRGPGRRGTPVPLQAGHRAPVDEGLRGGGRGIPLLAGAPSLRPEEGRAACFTRVVDVSVLEPGSDGTYGGVCPDGAVYNIEVDTTHTYLINDGLVVHNCHHATAASYRNVMAALGCYDPDSGTVAVGFTATLARGDGAGLGDVWDEAVFVRSTLWGIANGFLTDVRARTVDVENLDLRSVKRSGGDYTAKSLGDALMAADVPQVIRHTIVQHAADRRSIIVFTPTVEVAHAVQAAVDRPGCRAGVVHGGTPREDRLLLYKRFASGELRVLVNCMVLTEGADFPYADCAVIARPTSNEPLFIQMAGRVLRPSPSTGKTDALVLLLNGDGGSIRTLVDLDPAVIVPAQDGESLAEAYERQEEIRDAQEKDRAAREASRPLRFQLKHKDVDLFKASPAYQWLRTRAGVQFIPLGGNGEVLLWPSRETDGLWDVVWAPERGKWERLHSDVELGMAMAWGESEADERSAINTGKSASWRRRKASEAQIRFASSLGFTPDPGARAGDVGDMISVGVASRKIDRFVARV